MPRISVVMCVYNTNSVFLKKAVNSILIQSFGDFEFLIVDDCSSLDLFYDSVFRDPRIKLIRLDSNRGPAHARNVALKIAKGDYIAIMDSDDISYPDRFTKQLMYLDSHPNCVACGTWFKFIGTKNHEVRRIINDSEYYRCCLLFGNVPTLLNPTVMIRRKTLVDYNIEYDESLLYGEDYKMWMQISEHGIITNIEEVLFEYRVHENQLTNKKNKLKNKSQKNDSRAKEYLLSKIGVELTGRKKNAFFSINGLNHVNPLIYKSVLETISTANLSSHYFEQDKLQKRIDEQWANLVLNTNNIFKWFAILLFATGRRRSSILIKVNQIKKKLLYKKSKNV